MYNIKDDLNYFIFYLKGEIISKFLFLIYSCLYAEDIASLLFNGNCSTCHVEKDAKSAPSIIEVQKHYKSAFSKKEEFIKYMSNFALHPKRELSIMQNSVEKHGLMPELGYDIETLHEITEYIYDTEFKRLEKGI